MSYLMVNKQWVTYVCGVLYLLNSSDMTVNLNFNINDVLKIL